MKGVCEICGNEVDRAYAAFPIKGWEQLRGRGGANRIIARERDESRIAHAYCVERRARRERAGISDDQMTLAE